MCILKLLIYKDHWIFTMVYWVLKSPLPMEMKLYLFLQEVTITTLVLNTWYSKNAGPAPVHAVGLFHTAIVYPTRKDLAIIFNRIRLAKYPFTGASDHGVSEALYLNDPDGNGVELYWDKPKEILAY